MPTAFRVCVALVAVLLCASAVAGNDSVDVCAKNLYAPDGSEYYPVSLLSQPGSAPFSLKGVVDATDVYDFKFNLCAPVDCGNKGSSFSGCQNYTDSSNHYRGLGQAASATYSTIVPGSASGAVGFTASFTDGTECNQVDASGSKVARSMKIFAICDETAVTPVVSYLGETGYCEYDFEVRAAQGPCPVAVGPPNTPPVCHSDAKLEIASGSAGSNAANDYYYAVWELEQAISSPFMDHADILGAHVDIEFNLCGHVSCPDSALASEPAGCAHPDGGAMYALGTLASTTVAPFAEGMTVDGTPVDNMDGYSVTVTGGASCDPGNPAKSSSLVIHAVCDELMRDVDTPVVEFLGQNTDCVTTMMVKSHLACPLPLNPSSVPEAMYDECPEIISTGRGYQYNVAALTRQFNQPYSAIDQRFSIPRSYLFNMCGAVDCNCVKCGDDLCCKSGPSSLVPTDQASSCLLWEDDAGGIFGYVSGRKDRTYATTLRPDMSGYTLEYINGDPCESDAASGVAPKMQGRRTVIHAVCDPSAVTPVARFISESRAPCVTELELRSVHACPEPVRPPVRTTCSQAFLFSHTEGMAYKFHDIDTSVDLGASATLDGLVHEFQFDFCQPIVCPGAVVDDPMPTFCHSVSSPGASSPMFSEILGSAFTTTFVANDADDGFAVLYEAPEAPDGATLPDGTAAGALVHVECSSGIEAPTVEFNGLTEHGIIELTVRAVEGACPVPYTPSGSSSGSAPFVAGARKNSTKSFSAVLITMVLVLMVSCIAIVALQMYVNNHPDSRLPNPSRACGWLPCNNDEFGWFGTMTPYRTDGPDADAPGSDLDPHADEELAPAARFQDDSLSAGGSGSSV